jgi:acyl-CoA synthetase (AMP-forming)/AMP-acid ligase II
VGVDVCVSGFLRVKSAAVAGGEAVTADFGEVLASGEVCLRGRGPELLKLSGRRINPLEVERVLWRVAGTEVAQVKPYLDRFGELRTELSYRGPMSKVELRQVLCEYLSGWKVPHRIRLLNESNSLS